MMWKFKFLIGIFDSNMNNLILVITLSILFSATNAVYYKKTYSDAKCTSLDTVDTLKIPTDGQWIDDYCDKSGQLDLILLVIFWIFTWSSSSWTKKTFWTLENTEKDLKCLKCPNNSNWIPFGKKKKLLQHRHWQQKWWKRENLKKQKQ